jgi:hypothetical protein
MFSASGVGFTGKGYSVLVLPFLSCRAWRGKSFCLVPRKAEGELRIKAWRARGIFLDLVRRLRYEDARSFAGGLILGGSRVFWYRGEDEVWFDDGRDIYLCPLAEEQKADLEKVFEGVEALMGGNGHKRKASVKSTRQKG